MTAPVSCPNIAEEQISAALAFGVSNKILGAVPGSEINQIFHVITNCQPRNYVVLLTYTAVQYPVLHAFKSQWLHFL
jgi:hypothetical protein